MRDIKLKSVEFRREREQDWRRLEKLMDEADRKGLHRMSAPDVANLPVFYRGVLSSLSVARAISLDANLLTYLDNLANRAFIRVYGVRHGLREAFLHFLVLSFPREVRANLGLLVLATVLMALGVGVGFFQTLANADNYYQFVDASLANGRDPSATTEDLRAVLFDEEATVWAGLAHFASFLFTHNAQIGIMCFGLGIALGIPVFYIMFTNGEGLGAMAALYHQHGLSMEFWGWILPHGVTEFGALLLSATAGLVLAKALILPGPYTRAEALARQGRRAGMIILGCVLMLAVAALIEGFFRQLVHGTAIRYGVAGASLVLWTLYFARVGRSRS
jgi:uncharacterized membrane protein SpoIIM required for sporulation